MKANLKQFVGCVILFFLMYGGCYFFDRERFYELELEKIFTIPGAIFLGIMGVIGIIIHKCGIVGPLLWIGILIVGIPLWIFIAIILIMIFQN